MKRIRQDKLRLDLRERCTEREIQRKREIDIQRERERERYREIYIERDTERHREIGIVKLNYINIDIVKLKIMGASKGKDRTG